jgi:hypothetical protein
MTKYSGPEVSDPVQHRVILNEVKDPLLRGREP